MGDTAPILTTGDRAPRTALLVIDVQQGLFRKSTPIYKSEQLLANIETLVARAHAAGALVVYVQHASDKVLPYGSADWQIHPRLHPGPEDLIIGKQHGDAFEETTLQSELVAWDQPGDRSRTGDAWLCQGYLSWRGRSATRPCWPPMDIQATAKTRRVDRRVACQAQCSRGRGAANPGDRVLI